jgi:excisionase family DNA binding protein
MHVWGIGQGVAMPETTKTAKNVSFTFEPQQPLFNQLGRAYGTSPETTTAHSELVGADGTRLPMSEELFQILKEAIPLLEHQRASVTISPAVVELTTQQAADVLNVSRPFLIKLLSQGDIPFVMVGTHRRIRWDDLDRYKQQRDTLRDQTLDALTALMEEEEEFFQ